MCDCLIDVYFTVEFNSVLVNW